MVYRHRWFAAGVLATSIGLTGNAAAQLPAAPVQTAPLSIALPTAGSALPVPIPALPALPPAPAVTAPALTVAPLAAPSVSAPSVSTPSLSPSAGSVPSVSTPAVSTPSANGGAAPGSAPSGAGGSSGAGGTSGATGTESASPAAGSGAGARRGSSVGLSRSPAAKTRRRDRALRHAVLRFQGCLPRVPRAERRVLTLRAGVGVARAHSRSEVARITHLRRARVVTLERRGLRRLHALDRAGACQDARQATPSGAPASTAVTPPPGSAAAGPGALPVGQHAGDSNTGGAQGHRTPTAELSVGRPPSNLGSGGSDLTIVLASLAVFAFVLAVTREVKRAA